MNKSKLFALGIAFSLSFALLPINISSAANLEILEISPSYAYSNTDFNFVMKITGRGFVENTMVEIFYPTFGLNEPQIKSVTLISANELRAEVEIPFNTYAGFYNVKLTNPNGGTSFIQEGGLELKKKTSTAYFYPVIFSINPPIISEAEQHTIVIIGEQFAGDNPLVRLIKIDGSEYYDLESVGLNHQEIQATVPDNILVGTYNVLVRNTGSYGGNQFIKISAFIVESGVSEPEPEPEPVLPPSDNDESLINVPLPPAVAPNNIPSSKQFDYRGSFIAQNGSINAGDDGVLTHIIQANRGSEVDMWIQFKNTSAYQWWFKDPLDPDNIHEIRLGLTKDADSPFTHSSWISTNRLAKIGGDVLPGEVATLNFKLFIPENLTPGNYKLSIGLVTEWIQWIYDDVHWEIQVT